MPFEGYLPDKNDLVFQYRLNETGTSTVVIDYGYRDSDGYCSNGTLIF